MQRLKSRRGRGYLYCGEGETKRPLNFTDPSGLWTDAGEGGGVIPDNEEEFAAACGFHWDPELSRAEEEKKIVSPYLEGLAAGANVVGAYTTYTAFLADEVGSIPLATVSGIGTFSTVAGAVAAIPSLLEAIRNPNIDTISTAAGNTIAAAAGPLGPIAGPEIQIAVKIGGETAKAAAELNQSLSSSPIEILESIFDYLVRY